MWWIQRLQMHERREQHALLMKNITEVLMNGEGFWMIRSGRRILRTCLHFGRRLEIWKMMHRLKPMINGETRRKIREYVDAHGFETTEKPEHYRKCMIGILCQIV